MLFSTHGHVAIALAITLVTNVVAWLPLLQISNSFFCCRISSKRSSFSFITPKCQQQGKFLSKRDIDLQSADSIKVDNRDDNVTATSLIVSENINQNDLNGWLTTIWQTFQVLSSIGQSPQSDRLVDQSFVTSDLSRDVAIDDATVSDTSERRSDKYNNTEPGTIDKILSKSYFLVNPLLRGWNMKALLTITAGKNFDNDFSGSETIRSAASTEKLDDTVSVRNRPNGINFPLSSFVDPEFSISNTKESSSFPVSDLRIWQTNNTRNRQDATVALIELNQWNNWVSNWWQKTSNTGFKSAEVFLRQIDVLISEASSAVSLETIQSLVLKSNYILTTFDAINNSSNVSIMSQQSNPDELFMTPDSIDFQTNALNQQLFNSSDSDPISMEQALYWNEAATIARETVIYASNLLSVVDGVLRKGYVQGDAFTNESERDQTFLQNVPAMQGSKALFDDFSSAYELNEFTPEIQAAAEMGVLAGAIYEDTIPRTHAIGHTIVCKGTTEDVSWMITDSVSDAYSLCQRDEKHSQSNNNRHRSATSTPVLVRTLTIRGFDASDEQVDRERLLTAVVSAAPERIRSSTLKVGTIYAHSGLLRIARAIFIEIKPFIDWLAPCHRVVLNGHSIGGSVALLLLLLFTQEKGTDFVVQRVAKVYTFGCPPTISISGKSQQSSLKRGDYCEVLDAFGLPSSLVHSYIQPWDPIVRLFSEIDPLYPLIGDIGDDGVTPWVSGPYRTLRPIAKAIVEAWKGWPRFRDKFKDMASQNYNPVGIQHLLLPEPSRYLADRFISVKIPVPPVVTVLRIAPSDLYSALEAVFPLDVFEVSFIPQAIRSFVHHFYPAYGFPIVDYLKELERRAEGLPRRSSESNFSWRSAVNNTSVIDELNAPNFKQESGIDWKRAVSWLLG